MTCAKISEWLTDFVLGELPPDIKEVVNEHLQNCAECRSEHLALEKITSELKEMASQIDPPEYLSYQLDKVLTAEIGSYSKSNKWRQPKFIIQFVATFLIAFVGWGIWDNQRDSKQTADNTETLNAVVLEQRERPSKEAETEVQDSLLPPQQFSGEPVQEVVETLPEPKSEPAPALEPVTPKVVTKSAAPPEIQSLEILRTEVADQNIVLDAVQQVNIKLINETEREQLITPEDNIEVISMIVEGINNALSSESEEETMNEDEVTHIITIQLDSGVYTLNYCLPKNIGFGEGSLGSKVFHPGESLPLALENLEF